jgi:serine/threonine-protein kinase HipA
MQAMAIGKRSLRDAIEPSHWLTLVPDTRGAQRLSIKDMDELAERIRSDADELRPL